MNLRMLHRFGGLFDPESALLARKRQGLFFGAAAWLGVGLVGILSGSCFAAAWQRVVPWTASKVHGSPEPPSPYLAERAFPGLQFSEPIEFVPCPGGPFVAVAELKGKIFLFDPSERDPKPALFADLKASHPDLSNFYGLAFHPGFATNRQVFVCYVLKDSDPDGSRVSRFRVRDEAVPRMDPSTEEVMLTFLGGGHNGGSMHFGNDGMLYISTGDGRGPDPPDPLNTGQDVSDLLSSVLRIDVDRRDPGKTYAIPKDNPFVATPGARGEVWAFGFRNPWRMIFAGATGDLWVGDVGWELWEMIYRVRKGGNYGWSVLEGKQEIKPGGTVGPAPLLPATAIHSHSEAASVTGGYVYRGRRLPGLRGSYVYGDWETGKIWSLRHDEGAVKSLIEIVDTTNKVVCFGEDHAGELYYLDSAAGTVHRLVENPEAGKASSFPRKLSETGVFSDIASLKPAPGVVAFAPSTPLWRDGAAAERFVAVPARGQIDETNNAWLHPRDSVWVKTYSLDVLLPGGKTESRRVETQLLHFTGDAWNACSYRWNDTQTDAVLVERSGAEAAFRIRDPEVIGEATELTWRFHSSAECLRCHNPWSGTLLGFSPSQIKDSGSLDRLLQAGLFKRSPDLSKTPGMTSKRTASDPHAEEAFARSYLHANCSHCHREHGGGSVLMFLNIEMPLDKTGVLDVKPAQGTLGIADARIVAPGDPHRSVLHYRMSKQGSGHMPYLGSSRVDAEGLAGIRSWIASLGGSKTGESATRDRLRREADLGLLRAATASLDSAARSALDRLFTGTSAIPELVDALQTFKPAVALQVKERGLASADPYVRDLFERYLPAEKRAKTLGLEFQEAAVLGLRGDAVRGRKFFFDERGAQCSNCHRIGEEGKSFGPDLTHIGGKYTRAQLLEQIRYPSKQIEPVFAGYVVETRREDVLTGMIVGRSDASVVLKLPAGEQKTLARADILKLEAQKLSLMPEGLMQGLTAQQAADLIEYLGALK